MKRQRSSRQTVAAAAVLRGRSAAARPRRGVAVLIVLLLLSITLGLSYAAVRSQHTGVQIQRNSSRQIAARRAALTGLTMALKKMHTADWGGVDSSLSGSLGAGETFTVTYTAGDPSLDAADGDYEDLPYRVTLLAVGHATDPDDPGSPASYEIRAVVRLVPRGFGAEPTDWGTMQNYTLFQTEEVAFEVDLPCRIEGPVRVQGKLKTARHYPNDFDAWARYLEDLSAMRGGGYPDYRPFNGPVDLPYDKQDWLYRHALMYRLDVPTDDVEAEEIASDWARPELPDSYQIYEGGPTYTIPGVPDTLEGTTLEADPLSNPLGIYYNDGTVEILGNVTIRGSLYCKDDLKIKGGNVHFQPVELPALHGSAAAVRLPAISCRQLKVESAGGGDVAGLVAVFEEFEIMKGPETAEFQIVGRVVTEDFYIKERQPWDSLDWDDLYEDFQHYLYWTEDPVPYFPVWMGYQGRNPQPLLTVKPDSDPIRYHWYYPGDRIFEPDPGDDGLRWDLLEWTENP